MTRLRTFYGAVKDAIGRVVHPATIGERQSDSPRLAHLHRTWGDHPVRGLTPQIMAGILDAAEGGDLSQQSRLFADMRDRDPHLDAEMGKRERAILTLPWTIEPPPNPSAAEVRATEAVRELVGGIKGLEDLLLGLMDGCGHGFVCLEYGGWTNGKERLPVDIQHREQSWFQLDQETRTEIRLRDQTGGGETLWPMGWIVHRHAARSGYIYRSGLYRVLTWPWIMRQFSLRDMAEWLEIYGLPMRLGHYPPGSPQSDKDVLYRAVRDLGRHAAGIMPEGMRIELLAAAQGAADPFTAMITHAEALVSRACLGGSLSSTPAATGMGSGVAELQGDVRRDLLVSDARQIAGTLSTDLIWPITALNGLSEDPRRAPRWRIETRERADLTAFSQSLERLQRAGVGPYIPIGWVREQAGIPVLREGEPVLGHAPSGTGSTAPVQAAARLAAEPTQSPRYSPGQQRVEQLVDATVTATAPLGGPIPPARLRAVIAAASGPEDLERRLIKLWGDELESSDFRAYLERALYTADVLGYSLAEAGVD